MEISIVIPVYNAEKSLRELNRRIADVMETEGWSYEIILVDDGSRDGSRRVIRELAESGEHLHYIFFRENAGQQAAIFAGLRKSIGQVVITIDDDLQHPPEDIPLLVDSLESCDGVFGFPYEKPHTMYRRWGSKMTNWLFNRLLRKDKDLKISSFRAIRRPLVDRMIDRSPGFVYISALMILSSDRLKTQYHQQFRRKYGGSNYTLRKLTRLYLDIAIEYGDGILGRLLRRRGPMYRIEEEK